MTARRGGEAAPPKGRGQAPPPARTPTFVDVAEDMQPRLDAPLHGVEQLHAAHALHLLGDPVQEACAGETMGGKHSGRWSRRGQAAASAASEARRSRTHEASPAAGPPQPCPASAVSGGPAWGRAASPHPVGHAVSHAYESPEWAKHMGWRAPDSCESPDHSCSNGLQDGFSEARARGGQARPKGSQQPSRAREQDFDFLSKRRELMAVSFTRRGGAHAWPGSARGAAACYPPGREQLTLQAGDLLPPGPSLRGWAGGSVQLPGREGGP